MILDNLFTTALEGIDFKPKSDTKSLDTVGAPRPVMPTSPIPVPHDIVDRLNGKKTKGATRAVRNNNPFNIKYGRFAAKYGAKKEELPAQDGGNFAVFPDVNTGLQAGRDLLLSKNYRNLTVDQALKRWSNSGYGGEIYPQVANKTVATLNDTEMENLQRAMIKREDASMAKQLGFYKYGGCIGPKLKKRKMWDGGFIDPRQAAQTSINISGPSVDPGIVNSLAKPVSNYYTPESGGGMFNSAGGGKGLGAGAYQAIGAGFGILGNSLTTSANRSRIPNKNKIVAGSALSGVGTGASIGSSILPGWGTLIGGVVGGVAGLFSGKSKARRRQREYEFVENSLDEQFNQEQLARSSYLYRQFNPYIYKYGGKINSYQESEKPKKPLTKEDKTNVLIETSVLERPTTYYKLIKGFTKDIVKDPRNIVNKLPKALRTIPGPVRVGLLGVEAQELINSGIEESINTTGYYPPTKGSVGLPGQPKIRGKFKTGGDLEDPEFEVEKKEIVMGDDIQLTDGKRLASNIQEVTGYTHKQINPKTGGTGVYGKGSGIVFSNSIDLGNGKTPAYYAKQLAKKLGKFELDLGSGDRIKRKTAEVMTKKLNTQLEELFNLQESLKVPVYKYGGRLPKLAEGGGTKVKSFSEVLQEVFNIDNTKLSKMDSALVSRYRPPSQIMTFEDLTRNVLNTAQDLSYRPRTKVEKPKEETPKVEKPKVEKPKIKKLEGSLDEALTQVDSKINKEKARINLEREEYNTRKLTEAEKAKHKLVQELKSRELETIQKQKDRLRAELEDLNVQLENSRNRGNLSNYLSGSPSAEEAARRLQRIKQNLDNLNHKTEQIQKLTPEDFRVYQINPRLKTYGIALNNKGITASKVGATASLPGTLSFSNNWQPSTPEGSTKVNSPESVQNAQTNTTQNTTPVIDGTNTYTGKRPMSAPSRSRLLAGSGNNSTARNASTQTTSNSTTPTENWKDQIAKIDAEYVQRNARVPNAFQGTDIRPIAPRNISSNLRTPEVRLPKNIQSSIASQQARELNRINKLRAREDQLESAKNILPKLGLIGAGYLANQANIAGIETSYPVALTQQPYYGYADRSRLARQQTEAMTNTIARNPNLSIAQRQAALAQGLNAINQINAQENQNRLAYDDQFAARQMQIDAQNNAIINATRAQQMDLRNQRRLMAGQTVQDAFQAINTLLGEEAQRKLDKEQFNNMLSTYRDIYGQGFVSKYNNP